MKDLLDLSGKVAIITGASSGMGEAMARKFAERGAIVIALARRKERLEKLAKENKNIVPFAADVTKDDDIKNVVKFTTEKYERIDILVNNAGVMDEMVPIENVSDEMWDKIFEVNTKGVMRLTREVIKGMIKKEKGVILNIASVGGLNGCRAGVAYTASKHAVVGMTKNTAFMYANKGIRCNAICPGGVKTEVAEAGMKNPDQFGVGRMMMGAGAMPRQGEAEEVANLALCLVSDMTSLVNGAIITADAGWTAY